MEVTGCQESGQKGEDGGDSVGWVMRSSWAFEEPFQLSGGSRSCRAEAAVLGLGARKCQGQRGI